MRRVLGPAGGTLIAAGVAASTFGFLNLVILVTPRVFQAKFGGPKGVGALRLVHEHNLEPLVHGGGQEAGRRAGTENLTDVLGMAGAAGAAVERLRNDLTRVAHKRLRNRLIETSGGRPGWTGLDGGSEASRR